MNEEIVIHLENVSKTFYIREDSNSNKNQNLNIFPFLKHKKELKALQNVNLEIKKGEFYGIIGRNGSGKSTLLKLIMGAFPPDKGGEIYTKGKLIRLALGIGFDLGLSARENIYVNGSVLGLSFKKIGRKFNDIIKFAELEKFVDTPVKYYSSGMRSRLAFAIAVHAEADIFLMDEFFGGVGDESFRKKSDQIFKNIFLDGKTIIQVSHQPKLIRDYCDRVLMLDQGEVKMIGKPNEVLTEYSKLFNNKVIPQRKKGRK